MELIATYEAVWLEGRSQFELCADSIRVSGSVFLRGDFETSVPLATLQPRVERLRIRSRSFDAAIAMTAAAFIGASVLVAGFNLDPFGFAVGLIATTGIAGVVMGLATVRKTEFARFLSDAGVPVLQIARSGRDQEHFEEFVGLIVEHIRIARTPPK